jgi:hypothetical protein
VGWQECVALGAVSRDVESVIPTSQSSAGNAILSAVHRGKRLLIHGQAIEAKGRD